MGVPPESIEAGKCYLTTSGHVRRVVRIMPDGRIQFEHRSGSTGRGFGWKVGIQDGRSFTSMIEREVPCDWTSETDEAER